MDEDNLLKKKSRKNHHHNNQSKNNKKKKLILENSGEIENLLLYTKQEEKKEELPKVEIPVIKAYELLQEMSFNEDDMEIVPKRKQSKFKTFLSKKSYKFGMGFAVLLFALFGASYSYFNYTRIDSRQADISSGAVYVKLVENASSITLSKMYPRTDEEARSRNDNYFDFTIKGKNTSDIKSVLYTISINNGENVSGKTRINPKYIKLDLQEKVNNNYNYLLEGVSLDSYTFTGVIPTGTTSEITREYRLRLWVSDELIISDTEPNASYTEAQFANLYANFDISVNSEDKKIAYDMFAKNANTATVISYQYGSGPTDNGDGLNRLSGTQNNSFPIYFYRGDVDDNNVIFGGYCWQMVRTTDTGGIKMIYNGEVTGTNEAPTCENTIHADRIISQGAYQSTDYNNMSGVGYMYNKTYQGKSFVPNDDIYYSNEIEYGDFDNNGTSEYRLISGVAGNYTCNKTSMSQTCATSRFVYQKGSSLMEYYISLTDGELVEDALYKMTGTDLDNVKAKEINSGYNLNTNDSTIKGTIESWFRANLTNEVDRTKRNYANYLEDTEYCNDRSFKTIAGNESIPVFENSGWSHGIANISAGLYFGTYNRLYNNWYSESNIPSLTCPNVTDQFKTKNVVAQLNYPVGLLTADEIVLAGAYGNKGALTNLSNREFYLYTGGKYWTLSPNSYVISQSTIITMGSDGMLGSANVNDANGIRPVVSLKLGIEFETGGDGTPTNPYVVKYN